MFDPQNFINQLAEYCEEEHVLALDGPGSDITEENGSIVKSIGALIDGHIGNNGISANLTKIKQFLKKQAEEAELADELLLICGVGWSRGGFVLCQMKEWLEQKSVQGKFKIQAIHLYFIDTVVGGPTDRLRYLLKERRGHYSTPINLSVHNYYSNSGNLNIWDAVLEYLPEKYQINTPFFSGVFDTTKTRTYSLGEKEYTHKTFHWLFPATHEALVGRPRNRIGQWAGDLVLADIVRHLSALSIKLDENWVEETIEKGQTALEQLRKLNINWGNNRKYLDFELPDTTLFGRELTEEDNINTFNRIPDFTYS